MSHTPPDTNNHFSLVFYIFSFLSKLLGISIITLSEGVSILSNIICIACAIIGLWFSWKSYNRNKRLDRERELEKKSKDQNFPFSKN